MEWNGGRKGGDGSSDLLFGSFLFVWSELYNIHTAISPLRCILPLFFNSGGALTRVECFSSRKTVYGIHLGTVRLESGLIVVANNGRRA
jgi:hypothetical protein